MDDQMRNDSQPSGQQRYDYPPSGQARYDYPPSGQPSYWQGSYQQPSNASPDQAYYRPPSNVDPNRCARQATASQSVYQKDHIAAGLLAIFLGAFGIHKFYLGYNQAGFIMLAVSIIGGVVTFGLAAAVISVIAFVEGIIYLIKSQTEFDQIYVVGHRDWF